jgi:hypothetical protein
MRLLSIIYPFLFFYYLLSFPECNCNAMCLLGAFISAMRGERSDEDLAPHPHKLGSTWNYLYLQKKKLYHILYSSYLNQYNYFLTIIYLDLKEKKNASHILISFEPKF